MVDSIFLKNTFDKIRVILPNITDWYISLNLASQKGVSNWLSVKPLKKYNFSLNKFECKDGLHRDMDVCHSPGLTQSNLPTHATKNVKGVIMTLR